MIRPKVAESLRVALPEWSGLPASVIDLCLNKINEGVIVADMSQQDQPICFVNDAFVRCTGYSRQEIIGKNCRFLQGKDVIQPEINHMREAIIAGEALSLTIRNYKKDNSLFYNNLNIIPIVATNGKLSHYLGIVNDVTFRYDTNRYIEHISTVDYLTQALNRVAFTESLKRDTQLRKSAILLVKVDIARFHDVNSGYGYEKGDALLREIASRLKQTAAFCVGRTGTNEFSLAFHATSRSEADTFVADTIAAAQSTYTLDETVLSPRLYCGYIYALSEGDGANLIRQAGTALREAKQRALHEPLAFEGSDETAARSRIRLTTDLKHAIGAGEFYLEFQPKLDLRTNVVVGAEALIRWRHPVLGTQAPGVFIPHAEAVGLITEIDAWALRKAARFAKQVNINRDRQITIAVNISGLDISERDAVAKIMETIASENVDPKFITLELTETVMVTNRPAALKAMFALREAGLNLSIDDFGTGYSSLRYIEDLPISEIKIDRSFVRDLAVSPTKHIIVEALIKLGTQMGVDLVAEGIETQNEFQALKALGCPYGQGYLLGRPASAEMFLARLDQTE